MQGAAQLCTCTQGLGPSLSDAEGRAPLHCTGKENACRQQFLRCSLTPGKALLPFFLCKQNARD